MKISLSKLLNADCPLDGCPGILTNNGNNELKCQVCATPVKSVNDWRHICHNNDDFQTEEARRNRWNFKRQMFGC